MSSAYVDSYSRHLRQWLGAVGLGEDPFALYEAEREGARLSAFFIDRPYLYELLGDPTAPQAAFLMAERGCGKTATRAMITYECHHGKFKSKVLAVDYTDFGYLLSRVQGDISRLAARDHVYAALRAALRAVADDVMPDRLKTLSEVNRRLLLGFAQEFADVMTLFQLNTQMASSDTALDFSSSSSREILRSFARLIAAMGWQAMYVLVDRVDEMSETRRDPLRAVELLTPLVAEQALLELPVIAFKFFLPVTTGLALEDKAGIRRDRVCMHTIRWEADDLTMMVRLRLAYFSQDRVARLEDICAPGVQHGVMDKLIKTCDSSPRTLLRLCRALIRQHVKQSPNTLLISSSDVTQTLYEFSHQLEREHEQPQAAERVPGMPVSGPPAEGFFLDDYGHAWMDGVKMEPPPSPSELHLLQALYRRSPQIVNTEELIEAVWAPRSKPWEVEGESFPIQDETNLRKLVARLRARLESQFPKRGSDLIQNVRGRGYWLKVK